MTALCTTPPQTGHSEVARGSVHLPFRSRTGLRLRLLRELSRLSLLLSFLADSLSRSAAAASFFACMK